jgi:hypothetical protein
MALCLVGCALAEGDPVRLITGTPTDVSAGSCYTDFAVGRLVVDPTYGTAIADQSGLATTPVAWRPGFTARRVGSEVVVHDAIGNVVATTGRTYKIAGGYVGGDGNWPDLTTRVFWACGFVIQQ